MQPVNDNAPVPAVPAEKFFDITSPLSEDMLKAYLAPGVKALHDAIEKEVTEFFANFKFPDKGISLNEADPIGLSEVGYIKLHPEPVFPLPQYVAGFLFNADKTKVALIRKTKPAWQAGKLNGIGGKIEPGESPLDAMCREFKEETGTIKECWRHFATMFGGKHEKAGTVYWFEGGCRDSHLADLESPTEEIVQVWDVDRVAFGEPVKNLLWLIQLALTDGPLLSVEEV